ncbi:PepSY domain-containing protein [Neobacillus sp. NRS-1170]|uniref:PepSY domain-containing protein n=1 Tax=Neobacillus sp. NRS-1170 TaxID=3233898 RepID=UPI003D2CC5A6
MKKKGWKWLILCVFLAGVIFIGWNKLGPSKAKAEFLTEKEAQILVENRYQGTVTQIKLAGKQYHMKLEKQKFLYLIKIDATNGKILFLQKLDNKTILPDEPSSTGLSEEKIKAIILAEVNGTIASLEKLESNGSPIYKAVVTTEGKQTTITVNALTGSILSTEAININEPPKSLTESEAGQIAITQVKGIVDHIWLETKGDVTYYLIKVKSQNGQEAVVQVHAITGKVLSVTWDDRKKEDENNKVDSKADDDQKIDDKKKDDKKDDNKHDDN